ncbi:MAG: hypothetical protein KGL39_08020 [Patescibacteria group bacterium]|nr:hypothetical protein [Patescibacteria group bacterium]
MSQHIEHVQLANGLVEQIIVGWAPVRKIKRGRSRQKVYQIGGGGSGSGSVTSVGLVAPAQFSVSGSPVTSSGNLTLAWHTQSANTFLAGPTGGGASAPTFRTLSIADWQSVPCPVFQTTGDHTVGSYYTAVCFENTVPATLTIPQPPPSSSGGIYYAQNAGTDAVTVAPAAGWATGTTVRGQASIPPGGSALVFSFYHAATTVGDLYIAQMFANPMTTSGGLIIGGAKGQATNLPPNTTGTNKFLRCTSSTVSWATLTAADLPVFVAAGASHAAGAVPDPGATAHTPPYWLGEDSTWHAQTSITQLGTITVGVWNGTKIGLAYGGTNADLSGTGGTGQFLKQSSAGAAITVGTIGTSDLPSTAVLTTGANPFAADQSMGSHRLTNVTDPSGPQDAATKNYVDTVAQGLTPKPSAKVATTAGLAAYTYANGSSGVGATITFTATGTNTIDGYTTALGDRVLVKNETSTNAPNNGLYKVTTAGAGGVAGVWTRDTSMDVSGEFGGSFITVESGTANAETMWCCTTDSPTVGTTNITFAQFAPPTAYTADEVTLHLSGTQFSIKSTYVGQTSITTVGTIGTGTWQGAIIAPTYLTAMVAAGVSHSAGIVPDPGSSSHSPVYFLGDNAAWHPQTDITSLGTVTVGTWQGSTIDPGYLAGMVAAGAGHQGGIVPDPGASAHVPSYYLGDNGSWHPQTDIVHVGTITIGTWNGTTVDVAHGGTGRTSLTANALLIGEGTAGLNVVSLSLGQQVYGQTSADPIAGNPAAIKRFNINGGFDYFQAQGTSSASYTFAGAAGADTYVCDGFLANNQTGLSGWAVSQVAGGPHSTNYIKFLQSARADKLLVYQPIEAAVAQALSNGQDQVTLQVYARMPAGAVTAKLGVLEWAGTADTMALTTSGLNSAWASTASSDPTWRTNWALKSSASLALSSSWQLLSVTISALSASKNNLALVLWLDSQTTSSGELDLAEFQLTPAPCAVPWYPEDPTAEVSRCRRYYRKWSPSVVNGIITPGAGVYLTATNARLPLGFTVPMRVAPTVSVSAANNFFCQGSGNLTPSAFSPIGATTDVVVLFFTVAGATAGQAFQLIDNTASATSWLQADARLA